MKYDSDIHPRKSIRLKDYDYSRIGAYFITICTYEKEHIFGNVENERMSLNQFGKMVLEYWNSLPGRYTNIELDAFAIMPNHVHGIIKIIEIVGAIHELPLQNRKALDDIVFDILGLTQEERNEVYWAVCELVKNRLDKARSV